MLEIFLLVKMCRYVNRVATAKGYPGWTFAAAMGVSWFVLGVGGAILGAVTSNGSGDDLWVGWALGYVCGVAVACGLNALGVNLLAEQPGVSHEQAARAEVSERDYVEWRKRQLPRARRAEEEGAEPAVVELATADATPPPRANRVWERKWGGD